MTESIERPQIPYHLVRTSIRGGKIKIKEDSEKDECLC